MSDVLGPPKRVAKKATNAAKTATENWVPVDGKPHLWRDANSHPDPAMQRLKYAPPVPASPASPWFYIGGTIV